MKRVLLLAGLVCLVGCSTPQSPEADWPTLGWSTNAPSLSPVTIPVYEPVFQDWQP